MPLFLLPFLSAAKSIFSSVMTFFSRPPGSWIGAALIVAWIVWYAHHHGYDAGRADCETAHTAAVSNEVIRQVKITGQVVERSSARTAQDRQTDESNRKAVAHVKAKVHVLPNSSAVVVPPDIADGLRQLR